MHGRTGQTIASPNVARRAGFTRGPPDRKTKGPGLADRARRRAVCDTVRKPIRSLYPRSTLTSPRRRPAEAAAYGWWIYSIVLLLRDAGCRTDGVLDLQRRCPASTASRCECSARAARIARFPSRQKPRK